MGKFLNSFDPENALKSKIFTQLSRGEQANVSSNISKQAKPSLARRRVFCPSRARSVPVDAPQQLPHVRPHLLERRRHLVRGFTATVGVKNGLKFTRGPREREGAGAEGEKGRNGNGDAQGGTGRARTQTTDGPLC